MFLRGKNPYVLLYMVFFLWKSGIISSWTRVFMSKSFKFVLCDKWIRVMNSRALKSDINRISSGFHQNKQNIDSLSRAWKSDFFNYASKFGQNFIAHYKFIDSTYLNSIASQLNWLFLIETILTSIWNWTYLIIWFMII